MLDYLPSIGIADDNTYGQLCTDCADSRSRKFEKTYAQHLELEAQRSRERLAIGLAADKSGCSPAVDPDRIDQIIVDAGNGDPPRPGHGVEDRRRGDAANAAFVIRPTNLSGPGQRRGESDPDRRPIGHVRVEALGAVRGISRTVPEGGALAAWGSRLERGFARDVYVGRGHAELRLPVKTTAEDCCRVAADGDVAIWTGAGLWDETSARSGRPKTFGPDKAAPRSFDLLR